MSVYEFHVQNNEGKEVSLMDYQDQVLLIVNTASKCGFTPQYRGLEELYERFKDRGFSVLGFPCNQFGEQEPGSNEEIQHFCQLNYNVKFPVFAKIDVNGPTAHPLYKYLTKNAPGILHTEPIKWNFTKFLVSRDGHVIKRFAPATTPEAIVNEIEQVLINDR